MVYLLDCNCISKNVLNAESIDGFLELKKEHKDKVIQRILDSANEIDEDRVPIDTDNIVRKDWDTKLEPGPDLLMPLLPYQKEGLAWMVHQEIETSNRGGILADEMGMGKTIQAIALMLTNRPSNISPEIRALWDKVPSDHGVLQQGKKFSKAGTLIVLPTIAIRQWQQEILKYTRENSLRAMIYHGSDRDSNSTTDLLKYDVVITSYKILEIEYRKATAGTKVKCRICSKNFYPEKLRIHRKYFCGINAVRTAAQSKTFKKLQRPGETIDDDEDDDDEDEDEVTKQKKLIKKKMEEKANQPAKKKAKNDSKKEAADDDDNDDEIAKQKKMIKNVKKGATKKTAGGGSSSKKATKGKGKGKVESISDDEDDDDYEDVDEDEIDGGDDDSDLILPQNKSTGKSKPPAKKPAASKKSDSGKKKSSPSSSKKSKGKADAKDDDEDEWEDEKDDDENDSYMLEVERDIAAAIRDHEKKGKKKSICHEVSWFRVILDEAHMIKDRSTSTARSVFNLVSLFKFCLTGTPLQNRVSELYSLVRFLRIDPHAYYFCKAKGGCSCKSLHYRFTKGRCDECTHTAMVHYCHFNKNILNPIKRSGSIGEGKKAYKLLQTNILDEILLRRTKTSRADDIQLPPRIVTVRQEKLDANEEDYYEALYTQVSLLSFLFISSHP